VKGGSIRILRDGAGATGEAFGTLPTGPFDLVIVTLKATALEPAIPGIRPYATAGTFILPILNGMSHIALLEEAFPCQILGRLAKDRRDAARRRGPPDDRPRDAPGIELTVSEDVIGAWWAN
jgi:2-dehydropantoate 2-reductase